MHSPSPAPAPVSRPRALRVLIVAPSLDILGGQAVQASRLLERLRREPNLHVDLLPVNPRLPPPFRALQRIKYLRTLVTFPTYLLTLALTTRRYDVVHIFSASYLSFVLAPTPALVAAQLWRKRVILNYRSGEAEDHFRRCPSAVRTLRLADEIVVPSGYLVEVFGALGVRATAVPNFVDLEAFRFRERPRLAPVFFSNRNLEPLYNVGCTLDAFARVQGQWPEARLVIAGDGSERRALETRVRDLQLRRVTFLGKVAPQAMAELYQGADIYLNSSVVDNMPSSLIEAFACGLPVVTSDAGGIPYFVEHNRTALMFPKGEAAAMADQIQRLLTEPGLARSLIANALRECDAYRWASVRDSWLAIYRG